MFKDPVLTLRECIVFIKYIFSKFALQIHVYILILILFVGVLYYVDIPKGRVIRYDPKNGGASSYVDIDDGKDPVSFVIPSVNKNEYLIGKARSLCRLYWDFKQKEKHNLVVLAEVDKDTKFQNNRFNDGKCDPMGRIYAGKIIHHFLHLLSFACYKS